MSWLELMAEYESKFLAWCNSTRKLPFFRKLRRMKVLFKSKRVNCSRVKICRRSF